jgi:hypothetical protein
MPSAPSQPTDPTFQQLQEILAQVAEGPEAPRLQLDLEALHLHDLAEVWDVLVKVDEQAFVRAFQQVNPRLKLETLKTQNPYQVAVGMLKVLSPEA